MTITKPTATTDMNTCLFLSSIAVLLVSSSALSLQEECQRTRASMAEYEQAWCHDSD